ncbi:MAG: hypothetical protein PUG91_07530 [Clostridiales bacterium]|nr:hypothetical protein [Clostridiales bacterium]
MTWDEARAAAQTFGFEAIAAAGTAPVSMPKGAIHPQAMGLIADPHEILPEARSVLLLVMPYRSFCAWARCAGERRLPSRCREGSARSRAAA